MFWKHDQIPKTQHSYRKLTHSNPNHQKYVVVNWCLGNTCNFSCSYCPDSLHNGSEPWPSFETAKNFCTQILKHYKNRKIYFEFTGGEVTMWKHLSELCQFLRENNARIGIISNGSRTLDYWQKIVPLIDHICLSFHPEKGREEHFLKVAKYCSEHIRTHINIMMLPSDFDRCLAFALQVKEIPNISMALQPLMENFSEKIYPYSPLQNSIINKQHKFVIRHIKRNRDFEYYRGSMAMVSGWNKKKHMAPQKFISTNQNNWKGWKCSIGLEQVVIDHEGNVWRGWCHVGGKIGHISSEDLLLPKKTVICNKSFCHCNLDIMATKAFR